MQQPVWTGKKRLGGNVGKQDSVVGYKSASENSWTVSQLLH